MPAPFTLVFDLDDTLYLERDFVRSGFTAVGRWLRAEKGIRGFEAICTELFAAGERMQVFNQALDHLGLGAEPDLLAKLIHVYRTHEPQITLADDARRYLESATGPHALITDGFLATQEAKVRVLKLDQSFGQVLCTACLGAGFGKPHPRCFEITEAWARPFGRPLVYVADNPLKDFVTPKARGWLTVQVARPERVHLCAAPDARYEPHASVASLDELDECLHALTRNKPAGIFLTGSEAFASLATEGSR
ncbi:HAD family hydrolase [Rhodoligotrophos ferricapiens]|uniref:HAD family hydrolase n=1 Tax=Rhodoligotrophos ferricapiens TaxID=3069264 RepID=UPI00315D4AA8